MFTGIVEALGRVAVLDGPRLVIAAAPIASRCAIGDSIAVNGVCLTVVEQHGDTLAFDLAEETLARTALGTLERGSPVNVERPLTLVTPLSGHLVQGHVDGVGTVRAVRPAGDGREVTVEVPENLVRYLVEKGSVALDGVSLTVARLDGTAFTVALIPHTLAATTFGERNEGDPVNVEVDVLAKYVERLIPGTRR